MMSATSLRGEPSTALRVIVGLPSTGYPAQAGYFFGACMKSPTVMRIENEIARELKAISGQKEVSMESKLLLAKMRSALEFLQ
jgi:hypothetical protein